MGHDVVYVGTKMGAEARLVPAAGFSLEVVDVRGFDRARPLSIFSIGVRATKATVAARRILKRFNPDVVVGMGGYVALPVCVAARSMRVPIVIHEQNIVLGLTNKVCKPFARSVAVSFEDTLPAVRRGVYVGNPVIPEIAEMDYDVERKNGLDEYDLDAARKTVLVFGGSQGARRINEAAVDLVELWSDRADRQMLHIAGRGNAGLINRADSLSKPKGLIYRGVEFVERMAAAYALADVALCRGGATTVAEVGAVGLPSVIVPYPFHRDRQQELHGRVLQRAGAATVVPDEEARGERLARELDPLLDDDAKLEQMAAAARSFGRPEAASHLARVVEEAGGTRSDRSALRKDHET
jgi:UDP-N-acetylglucosamine--N-acetylmuramyl-(pentapeptide) pyrophosphoryl-undecaprenol N-acetylglucosamine transferase